MRQIRLYDQDYSTVLLTTDDDEVAYQFLRDSGQEWLPIVLDYGDNWKSRWVGRVILNQDDTISTIPNIEFLKYMIQSESFDQ